jgi:two-component system nitrate/nitrite response regulator NarL
MAITVVLADDHELVLAGLARAFLREPDFRIVASCRDGEETLFAVRQHRPHVLVLDLRMPVMSGIEVLTSMWREKSPTRVLVLTGETNPQEAFEALRLGAVRITLKDTPASRLVQYVREIVDHDQVAMREPNRNLIEAAGGRQSWVATLTRTEARIVRMIGSGSRNREIADELHITEATVKFHLHNIYTKLQVDGRIELARHYRTNGLAG